MRIGVFYGSSTGDTERIALLIQNKIGPDNVLLHNIIESKSEDLNSYPFLIFGISTWGIGKIQEDWELFLQDVKILDISGKKIALFGLGDQESYPDTFADAVGILYDILISSGCSVVGEWPVSGYNYISSKAERNGRFIGLVLDERNQPELTEPRVDLWLRKINLIT
jgi:flavodoxin I